MSGQCLEGTPVFKAERPSAVLPERRPLLPAPSLPPGCISCPTGAYLTTGTSSFGPNITACTPCSGCTPDSCSDNFG